MDARELATDMYFAAIKADEGMSWIERTFEAVAGGWRMAPRAIVESLTTSTIENELHAYFRVGDYASAEARYVATGADIIKTIAFKHLTPYNELQRIQP